MRHEWRRKVVFLLHFRYGNGSMGKKYEEYQKIIASVYVLLILAMLPVYMKDGMNMIGDAKYIFYRNASMTLLPLWFLGTAAAFLYRRRKKEVLFPGRFSVTDFFAAAFAVGSSLSYLFSDYKDTAFWGYPGWYMGLTAQAC